MKHKHLLLSLFLLLGYKSKSVEKTTACLNSNLQQQKNDSLINKKDTFKINFEYLEIRKIGRIIKNSQSLGIAIKKDYPGLFSIRGFHPMAGYAHHGIDVLSLGIGYGKRNLLKPLTYSNFQTNILISTKQNNERIYGYQIGYTLSKMFIYSGIGIIGYFNNNISATYAFRPELGISVLGLLNIGYGYHIVLNQNHAQLNTHNFVVRYTHQSIKQSMRKKIREINFIFSRDHQKLKALGLDLRTLKQ
jgi:hypothetical protein